MILSRGSWVYCPVVLCLLATFVTGCPEDKPIGDATRGVVWYASGDGINPNSGCDTCHCSDARGGCQALSEPPNIREVPFELISDKIRDPLVDHTGGKFDFDNQGVADIEAFLGSLVP